MSKSAVLRISTQSSAGTPPAVFRTVSLDAMTSLTRRTSAARTETGRPSTGSSIASPAARKDIVVVLSTLPAVGWNVTTTRDPDATV